MKLFFKFLICPQGENIGNWRIAALEVLLKFNLYFSRGLELVYTHAHAHAHTCRDADRIVTFIGEVEVSFPFFLSSFFQNQATVTNSSWPIFESGDKLFIFFLSCLLEGRFSVFFFLLSFLKKRGKKKSFYLFPPYSKMQFQRVIAVSTIIFNTRPKKIAV